MSHRASEPSTSPTTPTTTSSSSTRGPDRRRDDEDIKPPRKPLGPTVSTYVGALLILIWGLAPFYWMLVTAFRDNRFIFSASPVPSHLTLDNFREALATDGGNNFLGAIINSVLISSITTALALTFGVFTASALARVDFRRQYLLTGTTRAASASRYSSNQSP